MQTLRQAVYPVLLLWMTLTAASCFLHESKLAGNWRAAAFYEQGQTVQVPLDSIRLVFGPDHRYHFRSIGQYSEAGPYRLAWRYLTLCDTTATPPQERVVELLFASADTLKIRMRHAEKEQVLFLFRGL
jgi:hypothetical protein